MNIKLEYCTNKGKNSNDSYKTGTRSVKSWESNLCFIRDSLILTQLI